MKEINNVELNTDGKRDAVKNSGELANKVAKKYGSENVKEFVEKTNLEIKSGDRYTRSEGLKTATGFVSDLALLILYQEVINSNDIGYMNNFTNIFNDGYISEGNSKEYIVSLDTGNETYQRDNFIPTKITSPLQENKLINMFKQDKTLADSAYQYKKPLTILQHEWLPYFKSGELKKFIDIIAAKMVRAYQIFKFDFIAKLLISLNPQKQITGTASNCFEAISREVFPEVENMIKYNNEYNLDANFKYVDTLPEENIVMVVGNKLLSRLKNGVESQLFNAQFFGPNSKPYMITSLNNKINIGNPDTALSTSSEQYVNEDTIYVFDKNLIKSLIHIESNESQAWAENMSIQLNLHVWGTIDTIPWAKIFKYTNPNLEVLP